MRPSQTRSSSTAESASSLLPERVELIYLRRARSLYVHVPILALALWLSWSQSLTLVDLALASLLLLYTLLAKRSAQRWFDGSTKNLTAARGSARALYLELALLGLSYNLIFLHLDQRGAAHALDYLSLILALLCAGAVATYQYLRGLAVVFIVFSITPLAVYHLLNGDAEGPVIAMLLMVFVLFMSGTALTLHRDAMERLTLTQQLKTARDAAELLARTDSLTGLLNRRALLEDGAELFAEAGLRDRSLSVILVDVDHFKAINDRFGHASGDAVLVGLAAEFRRGIGATGLCGRLGGEEFAILMPDTLLAQAASVAEKLRTGLIEMRVEAIHVTASFGIAERRPGELSLHTMINRADVALYQAKASGRNRVLADSSSVGHGRSLAQS